MQKWGDGLCKSEMTVFARAGGSSMQEWGDGLCKSKMT